MAGIKPVEVFERKQLEAPVVSAKGHRQNGFDLLRIIAATMVIYGHAFPLSGSVAPGILGNGAQSIGVKIFFIISGFLVTRSWLADPNLLRFAQRRAARIAPGLIVAVLFGTFVVGPLFTKISLAEYITSGTTWRYLANCVLYPVYSLPGVFQGNPFPNAVNGSLWSLPVEVLMYVLTPTILGTKAASRLTLSLFATALTIADIYFVRIAPPAVPPVFYGSSILQLLNVAVYFQIGALYALFHLDRYAFLKPSLFLLAGAGGIIHGPVVTELVLILLLPFAVVGAGTVHIPYLENITRGSDISYGLYLYAFPVQQAIATLSGVRLTPLWNFAMALPATMVLASASWYGIERPGLSLKPAARLEKDRRGLNERVLKF